MASTTARTSGGAVAGGAGDEHRSQDVGAVEEVGGGAFEADLALLHEDGAERQVEGEVHRLLDEDDGDARLVDALHDVEELCTSVLILDRGKILVAGTPADVTRDAGVTRLSEAFLAMTGTDPR